MQGRGRGRGLGQKPFGNARQYERVWVRRVVQVVRVTNADIDLDVFSGDGLDRCGRWFGHGATGVLNVQQYTGMIVLCDEAVGCLKE